MTALKAAREKGKLPDFIKEHEADPEGDADELDALLKRPVRDTAKEAPKASSRDASAD